MTIIPAIDLLDGKCVRLFQGKYDQSTVYSSDPVETAVKLASTGINRLHIVDLNAARSGSKHYGEKRDNNRRIIKIIKAAVPCMVQTGGGIRSDDDVKELLDLGIERLILGTLFANNPDQASRWISVHGSHFIAGIDALNGMVKTAGWENGSSLTDLELAKKAGAMGFLSIVHTNIQRDGTMQGPDFERTRAVAQAAGIPVILSGGVKDSQDITQAEALEQNEPLIKGIIVGKALYEGAVDLNTVKQGSPARQTARQMEW